MEQLGDDSCRIIVGCLDPAPTSLALHIALELAAPGFDVQCVERTSYCWWFKDRLSMGAFCRLLFDMRGMSWEL